MTRFLTERILTASLVSKVIHFIGYEGFPF